MISSIDNYKNTLKNWFIKISFVFFASYSCSCSTAPITFSETNVMTCISPLKKEISTHVTPKSIIVDVTYHNISNAPIYVNPDAFHFYITLNNKKLAYQGIMEKMRPLKLEDYVKIEPNGKKKFSTEVVGNYPLEKGSNTYLVHGMNNYRNPETKELCISSIPETVASFTYTL